MEKRSITITRWMRTALQLYCGNSFIISCHLKACQICRQPMQLLSRQLSLPLEFVASFWNTKRHYKPILPMKKMVCEQCSESAFGSSSQGRMELKLVLVWDPPCGIGKKIEGKWRKSIVPSVMIADCSMRIMN